MADLLLVDAVGGEVEFVIHVQGADGGFAAADEDLVGRARVYDPDIDRRCGEHFLDLWNLARWVDRR